MTIEQKRNALESFCLNRKDCVNCPCIPDVRGHCYSCKEEEHVNSNYERVFGILDGNPYWQRITALAHKHKEKGMSKYGQGLVVTMATIKGK